MGVVIESNIKIVPGLIVRILPQYALLKKKSLADIITVESFLQGPF